MVRIGENLLPRSKVDRFNTHLADLAEVPLPECKEVRTYYFKKIANCKPAGSVLSLLASLPSPLRKKRAVTRFLFFCGEAKASILLWLVGVPLPLLRARVAKRKNSAALRFIFVGNNPRQAVKCGGAAAVTGGRDPCRHLVTRVT